MLYYTGPEFEDMPPAQDKGLTRHVNYSRVDEDG